MKRKNENKIKRKIFFLGIFLMSILGSVAATMLYYRDNQDSILKSDLFKLGTVIFILVIATLMVAVAKIIYYLFCIFKKK